MAIASLPSCASRRFVHHAGCVAFVPLLSSPGPSSSSSVSLLSFPPLPSSAGFLALRAVTGAQGDKVGSSLGGYHDPALLRRPLVSPPTDGVEEEGDDVEQEESPGGEAENSDGDEGGEDRRPASEVRRAYSSRRRDDWVDWEDQILGDTVPLVSFVRMLLHSGKYDSGDRLSPEHEKAIMERLLPYHPDFEKKMGCGIDFITFDLVR
ncbi:hypothetical protein Taro_022369 [Colocasia esculenta]|uniref:Protein DCL, chloroplastic n=1 Tax=Colocasia esculenta TaxID=4460 RepID=A0A843V1E8_COLES|nr:hypothetical protein [Colocasia esculenta]